MSESNKPGETCPACGFTCAPGSMRCVSCGARPPEGRKRFRYADGTPTVFDAADEKGGVQRFLKSLKEAKREEADKSAKNAKSGESCWDCGAVTAAGSTECIKCGARPPDGQKRFRYLDGSASVLEELDEKSVKTFLDELLVKVKARS